jgi:5-formyltetrahydrofolate cyclo-ligase
MTDMMPPTEKASPEKEAWRRRVAPELAESKDEGTGLHWGKAAAAIRKCIAYREAHHLLVPPSAPFFQVRLNALMDRKLLTVPSPGMQSGFQHFNPDRIPPKDRVAAARLRVSGVGLTRSAYGSPIPRPVDLVMGEAFWGDRDGGLIGDGRGHLDLVCAVLTALKWLDAHARILAVVWEVAETSTCPQEEHDVKAHWIITRQGVVRTTLTHAPRPAIHWEKLSRRQIRRNEVLFTLASRDNRSFA